MTELQAGDVVWLRGDLTLETPLTVTEVDITRPGGWVGVAWLDADKQLCTWFSTRASFMTEAQGYKDRGERERARRMAFTEKFKFKD